MTGKENKKSELSNGAVVDESKSSAQTKSETNKVIEEGTMRRLSTKYRDWFYQEGFFKAQNAVIDILTAKKAELEEPMDMLTFTSVVRKMLVREMAKAAGIELPRSKGGQEKKAGGI